MKMKYILRVISWTLLSLLIQASVLLYLDKVYFKHSSDAIQITEVKNVIKSKDLNVVIPADAKQIQSSFDAKYITYIQNNKLMIIDTDTCTTKEIVTNEGGELLYNNWIPKNNIIMVATKKTNSSGDQIISVFTYNAKNDVEINVQNDKDYKEPINYEDGIGVDNIVSSLQTGVTYVSVSRNKTNSKIYRIDTNGKKTSLKDKVPEIGDMKAYQHKDVLVYQDSLNKSFYYYTNGKVTKLNFDGMGDLVLLGANNDNSLVMGVITDNKVTNIISGQISADPKTWTNSITLDEPILPKYVHISENGDILVNDCLKGKILNLTKQSTISYDGKFIDLNDKVITSLVDNKIKLKSVEDIDTPSTITTASTATN